MLVIIIPAKIITSSFGADAVAAMGITQKINQVPMQIAMGLSQGIMPLVSYNYSSKNHKRMRETLSFTVRETLSFTVKISQGFLCTVALLYFVFAGPLTRMFMDNEIIVGYGIKFLRGFCLGMPFLCMDFLAVGVFQAVGMGRYALVFAIMRKVILEIPALYILNYVFGMPFLCMDFLAVGVFQAVGMGRYALVFAIMRKVILEIPALYILNYVFPLYGLAYAQLTAEVVLAVVAVVVLARLFKKLDREN